MNRVRRRSACAGLAAAGVAPIRRDPDPTVPGTRSSLVPRPSYVTARQVRLQADIAEYQPRYDALSAPQQQAAATHAGQAVSAAPAAAAGGAARTAVDTALAQVGDANVRGAGGPDAFDCSGPTQYAHATAGLSLPHSSRMQATMGSAVSRADLQPGDLISYCSGGSHVSMCIGNGQMVHASTPAQPVGAVSVDSMSGVVAMRRIA